MAWLAVQAASIGFPAFDAPPWALRIFILIALLGFPIAVVMAWVFDVTPEGVKLDADTSGSKRLFAAAALLIVLALGWYFYGQPSFRKGDVTTPVARRSELDRRPAVRQHERQGGGGLFLRWHDRRAVERARQGAATQGRGAHFRVSVQRTKAATSAKSAASSASRISSRAACAAMARRCGSRRSWCASQTAFIFGRRPTIANWRRCSRCRTRSRDVSATALKLSLGVSAPVAPRAPIDPEAYDEYLKGRALLRQRSELPSAIAHLKAAVAKAPEFAAGWSSLSLTYEVSFWYTPHMTPAARG